MPHFSIEYSSNLEKKVDIKNFCNILRLAGIETGVFPIKGIRVRAIICHHYSIADNNPENGFGAQICTRGKHSDEKNNLGFNFGPGPPNWIRFGAQPSKMGTSSSMASRCIMH